MALEADLQTSRKFYVMRLAKLVLTRVTNVCTSLFVPIHSGVTVTLTSLTECRKIKMASCMGCFKRCCDGNVGGSYVQMREQPVVLLDTSHMGHEVVIVKNGHRVCGTGAALANVPIVQNKAYFEMKLQQSGVWGVGLATRHCDLNKVPLGRDKESWVLTSEGTIVHNGNVLYKLSDMPMEGDIVGVSYDHVEINFYVNGKNLQCPVTGAKGEVFPVLYVDDGAILDAAFTTFAHQPPLGFDRILVEKSLL